MLGGPLSRVVLVRKAKGVSKNMSYYLTRLPWSAAKYVILRQKKAGILVIFLVRFHSFCYRGIAWEDSWEPKAKQHGWQGKYIQVSVTVSYSVLYTSLK